MVSLAAAALAAAAFLAIATPPRATHAAVTPPWPLSGALITHDPNLYKTPTLWWIFETTPNSGIGVKYSPDGRAWSQGLPIFPQGLPWWKSYVPASTPAQAWAPGCGEFNGTGYCYYGVSSFGSQNSAIGLTTSAGGIAAGAWIDHGPVITSATGSDFNAIDPSELVADSSGRLWLAFGSFWNGVYLTEVCATTLQPKGPKTNVARDPANGIENPFVVRRPMNGTTYYYLFASKGACCKGAESTYYIVYGRATSIKGPYVDRGGVPMLAGGGTVLASGGPRFVGPGAQSIAGTTVVAWHAYDSENNGNPVLFMNDLHWDADGWLDPFW